MKNLRHPLYTENCFSWAAVQDAISGSATVKRRNEMYLPMPQGFVEDESQYVAVDRGPSDKFIKEMMTIAPHYHFNKAYMAYLQRARFPEITINTMRGLVGVATRKESEITLPAKLEYMIDKATNKGKSLDELFVMCLVGTLSFGRSTILVDVNDKTNTVHLVYQGSQEFLNWTEDEDNGETTMALFEEKSMKLKANTKYEVEESCSYLAYSFKEDPKDEKVTAVTVTRFTDPDKDPEDKIPNLQGTRFEKIPVVTIGALENGNDPDPAPLLGVAEIAYSMYRKDADLSNAQFMTCNPMFTITGGEGSVPTQFGSTVALILENPQANAFFPTTDTSALDHVSKTIQELREEAAQFGAALLGPTKKAAESTETVKTRQGAQGATLVCVVDNVCKGITDALKIAAQISNAPAEDIEYSVSTDFSELNLSPQMLTALVGAWQAGIYSKESLIALMIEAGFAEGDVDDELTRLFTEGPSGKVDDAI